MEYIVKKDEPDFAILKLEEEPSIKPLSLSTDITEDMMILTVGYPWRDSRVQGGMEEIYRRIFNGIYDVKRASPGKIMSLNSLGFSHDCSTLKGNSGSACLNIETGEVVGIHYAGQQVRNLALSSNYLITHM